MSDLWNAMHLNDPTTNRNAFPPPNLGDLSSMPWSTPNPRQVMEFTAMATPEPGPNTSLLHTKRKPTFSPDPPVPAKKMLTEDSMAAHLSKLHITPSTTGKRPSPFGVPDAESLSNYTVNMTQWDLERKLRTAQKITVCNEIRDLERDEILPEILLNRIAKPCSALMLWQPPASITSLIDAGASDTDKTNTKGPNEQKSEEEESMET